MDGLEDIVQVKGFCEQHRVVVPIEGQRSGDRAVEYIEDNLFAHVYDATAKNVTILVRRSRRPGKESNNGRYSG